MTGPATILVADDAQVTVRLVHDVLVLHGYRVVEAYDGLEALEKIQLDQPDLLILDINMPRMDGFEVCRRLKGNPATAHIPVLMLSALESVNDRVKGLSLGAEDYVVKPFRPAELAARVEAHLRRKREVDALRVAEEYVRTILQNYLAPAVVTELLRDPGALSLGGTRRIVTVLFADISGFSSISEQLKPELAMRIVNDFLTLAGRAIFEQEGTLSQFTGDGLLALFNAPVIQEDHVFRAVSAALTIRNRLRSFESDATKNQRLQYKIGISTGEAVVGNAGMPNLKNYTAIGDTVNIAKRLEEGAEPDQILMSSSTFRAVKDRINACALGPVHVKGRSQAVQVYELLGREGEEGA
jgi:adenylate cyclase